MLINYRSDDQTFLKHVLKAGIYFNLGLMPISSYLFRKMRAIIVFLLIWLVVLDAFKLTQIVENAEEEIMQEIRDYNESKQPTSFYKSRKVTMEYVLL